MCWVVFTLYTQDGIPVHSGNSIIKFADDATVVGLLSVWVCTPGRGGASAWCTENDVVPNTSKTWDLIIDFRRQHSQPVHQQRLRGESLSRPVSDNLNQSIHTPHLYGFPAAWLQRGGRSGRSLRRPKRWSAARCPTWKIYTALSVSEKQGIFSGTHLIPNIHSLSCCPRDRSFRTLKAWTNRLKNGFYIRTITALNTTKTRKLEHLV